ncbi:putative coiled-coil domain-containing protein 180 isoform 3 [Scophthalmus maximus]|uniref:Putative coiled-coil domain-containing protein 180 isoform 3 n=1 Tax=Scophthalmus maximus TaxID=52904 RepID=A0A2U9BW77_SCOMX|nr:putative coiled-coil domain-containing protein 180 isoform 3 [Scophthalmus maximus]
MDSVGEDDLCWLQLEDFRMLLIKTIEPSRISPYLRQCQVISAEDEEQLFNDPALFIRRRKVGALLDILQRTGVKGYTAFLESLELDYPQVYSRITGKEPNRTFSILVDTAGESGLTQFLMTELSRLQRALQDERRRRQQACSVAKEQEAWSQQQQLRERQLATLTERVQKVQEERERLSDEAKQLRDHNYCLMADINTLTQDKSNALLANRDLQIEVERLKNSLLQAEGQTRLLRRWTLRPLQESLAPPTETFLQPPREEGLKEEQGEGLKEGQGEERKPEEKRGMNLLTTVFRLRREVHRAEEQRATSAEEKEELELSCSELKREARTYRQRIKQTLRQLEEVVRERDKALSSWAEQQAEVRLLLQQKDQYREQVRQLTERSDRLEHCLLRSQGEELQLRTRLRRLTYNNDQWQRSVSSEEEEEPTVNAVKGAGSRDKDLSETSVESEEATAGGTAENRTTASWERQTDDCLNSRSRLNFFQRRRRRFNGESDGTELVTGDTSESGAGHRQLFDAQVQLSMSLLAGRKDMRTNCLSAEDDNTHCSSTSSRRQRDDDDDDDDVSRLPFTMAPPVDSQSSDIIQRLTEKRRKKHEDALKQLNTELIQLIQVYEAQVRTLSQDLLSYLQEVDLRLDTLKDRMEHLDHVSLQDEVQQEVKLRKMRIMELNIKLTECESHQINEMRAVLRKFCLLLENIGFLLLPDVHRLIHCKAMMLNQSLLVNRRNVARLLLLLQEETLQQGALLHLHRVDCLTRWTWTRVTELTDHVRSVCSSVEDQQLISGQKIKDLTEQRCDIIVRISSLVPPTCSTALVSDWFNQLTAVNQQIDSLHADFLHLLRCSYEQTWQQRLSEVERCEEALWALQLREDEVNNVVGSQLLPLTGRSQSQDEQQLAALDVSSDSAARHALSLSRCVFVMMRGAASLWETHCRRLERREEEVERQLDALRRSQQQLIQSKKVRLDELLGELRQEGSEDALKTSLDRTVLHLQDVRDSCGQCVSDQCQLLDLLPSLLLDELLSYSSSLSCFYHLGHAYTPDLEELKIFHLGTETQKLEDMIAARPISCQNNVVPTQLSHDWLSEADSSLLYLCDISSSIKFTSSRGVVYTGPAFRCPAPDLQQETHLSLFPVELLTKTLSRTRTLFVDNLEQRFHDVLSSAIATATNRKEAVRSEQELHLQQLNPQHIHTHIYQPRLAELQLHRQRVDAHCEQLQDELSVCRSELQTLQSSVSRMNREFSVSLSNMEDVVLTAGSRKRLETMSSALPDCLDQHIQHTQRCQTTFRRTVQVRLDHVRHRTTHLLTSFRLFSEGGDFGPQELSMFQKKLRQQMKHVSVAEENMAAELEAFESHSLQQVKEASAQFEEKLCLLTPEMKFSKIQKINSSTRVLTRAECEPAHVCVLAPCLAPAWLQDGKSRKGVRSAPAPGLRESSRTGVELLDDPVIDLIKSLNRRTSPPLPPPQVLCDPGRGTRDRDSSIDCIYIYLFFIFYISSCLSLSPPVCLSDLGNLSVVQDPLNSLTLDLISNYERQQEAELLEVVGGVRKRLELRLADSDQEKRENVGRLRASLSGDELQMLVDREEVRQQQLHAAVCCSHLELQECVRVRGEEFVTSMASLTEKLFSQLDDLLKPAGLVIASLLEPESHDNENPETRFLPDSVKLFDTRRVRPSPVSSPESDTWSGPARLGSARLDGSGCQTGSFGSGFNSALFTGRD